MSRGVPAAGLRPAQVAAAPGRTGRARSAGGAKDQSSRRGEEAGRTPSGGAGTGAVGRDTTAERGAGGRSDSLARSCNFILFHVRFGPALPPGQAPGPAHPARQARDRAPPASSAETAPQTQAHSHRGVPPRRSSSAQRPTTASSAEGCTTATTTTTVRRRRGSWVGGGPWRVWRGRRVPLGPVVIARPRDRPGRGRGGLARVQARPLAPSPRPPPRLPARSTRADWGRPGRGGGAGSSRCAGRCCRRPGRRPRLATAPAPTGKPRNPQRSGPSAACMRYGFRGGSGSKKKESWVKRKHQ